MLPLTHRAPRRFCAVLLAAAVMAAAGLAAGQSAGTPPPGPLAAPAPRRTNVEVLVLVPQDLVLTGTYVGDLTPNERVVIRSEIDGLVGRVGFDESEPVRRGQVLVNIATEQAEVRRDQAKVNLELGRATFERNQALFEKQLIPPQVLDDSRTALDVARLTLQAAEIELQKSIVRSPIDGIVKTRHVRQGEFAQKGGLLAEILDLSVLIAKISVPEREVAHFKPGKRVTVALDALPRKAYPGTVRLVGPEADPKNRSFPVEIVVDNKDSHLRAGMLARVKADLIAESGQIVVPRGAVLERNPGRVAYVESGGRAELRRIELGATLGERVQILSGLAPGDRLIVLGQKALTPGETVRVLRESTQSAAGREGSR